RSDALVLDEKTRQVTGFATTASSHVDDRRQRRAIRAVRPEGRIARIDDTGAPAGKKRADRREQLAQRPRLRERLAARAAASHQRSVERPIAIVDPLECDKRDPLIGEAIADLAPGHRLGDRALGHGPSLWRFDHAGKFSARSEPLARIRNPSLLALPPAGLGGSNERS